MPEYAPGAPGWVKRYPAKLIGPAKITLWDLWSRARHEDQRGCEIAVVFVKPDPDERGSPAEIFRRHIAQDTGQTVSRVVAHLTKLRALDLVDTHGLAATLHWKPADPGSGKHDERSGKPDQEREEPDQTPGNQDRENRVKPPGKPDPGSGNPDRLSGKPGAPINSPSPPKNSPSHEEARAASGQPSLFGDERVKDPAPGDLVTPAKIRAWWAEVFVPLRAETLDRYRPGSAQPIACSDSRLAALRRRIAETCAGLPWAEVRERLTHVVRNAAARVDEHGGAKTSWGWCSLDAIAPKHWAAEKNFTRYYEAPPAAAIGKQTPEPEVIGGVPQYPRADATNYGTATAYYARKLGAGE